MSPPRRVVVVGAGVAGLVAAVTLAHAGLDVTVLERAAQPGGKLRQLRSGSVGVDAGPTVFTLRPWFEAMFDGWGESLAACLPLQPLPILARHAWSDGAVLDLHADAARTEDAIGRFAGLQDARRYADFRARCHRIFRTLEQPFMRASRPGPLGLAWRCGLAGLPALAGIAPLQRLAPALAASFGDARLRQLFGRYATYCGSSPALAPATLMLVADAEAQGVWQVAGGMRALATVLVRLAEARGARVRCASEVSRITVENRRVTGVQLSDGEWLHADAVVFNGDVASLGEGLLGAAVRKAVRPSREHARSLSAVTWTGCAEAGGLPLEHHNVFFADDAAAEFDDVFARGRLPDRPTVYLCAQDRPARGRVDAAAGPVERLLMLVNAPAARCGAPPTIQEIERCEKVIKAHLQRCGLRLRWETTNVQRTTPADFARLFPGTGGALYGQPTHGWRASFRRPGATTAIQGLVLAGGSVHPGPGLPMVATSGLIAAQALLGKPASRISTAALRPTATPGGISTR